MMAVIPMHPQPNQREHSPVEIDASIDIGIDHERPEIERESLRVFEPFANLPEAVVEAIREVADFRDYRDGETILSAGEQLGDEFYIVTSGAVTLTQSNPKTGELVVERIDVGHAFGIELALAPARRPISQHRTLTAIGDVQVWFVDSESFRTVAASKPTLAKNLLGYFSDELATLRFGNAQERTSPEQLICAHILGLVERDEIKGTWMVKALPRHRDLAKAAGTKEAEVATAVASLIRNQIADRNYPGLVINDMKRLEELAAQD